MQESELARAVRAAESTAASLGLRVDDTVVLHNSNKATVRLRPCDVAARVARAGEESLQFELDVARQLAEAGWPVASPEPRVAPRAYDTDRFVVALWTYYEPTASREGISSVEYATALAQLHAGLRTLDVATPHFRDRVAEAEQIVASRDLSPALADADRALLGDTLQRAHRTIVDRGAAEQPLHGEPHPGNVIGTKHGLVFIDFETCCRGPVEFDLAHVPEEVSAFYSGADQQLLGDCRLLVLAMVAAWRAEARDQLPDGERAGERLLRALRAGPPWPTLDAVMDPA